MTLGTSPYPLGAALFTGAEAETHARTALGARFKGCSDKVLALGHDLRECRRPLVRSLAGIYLCGLIGFLIAAFGLPGWGSAAVLGLGQAHLAFLMLAGAGMAVANLRADKRSGLRAELVASSKARSVGEPMPRGLTGLGDLLAQMSHELRTPLNAVIGFSEVMRHELHGPLNARYQEYAIHISESGGQMLKSSQDALAVAEAMTVLLGPAPRQHEDLLPVAPIVSAAWATIGVTGRELRLAADAAFDIPCEPRATQQALEHLLREACAQAAEGAAVEVMEVRGTKARRLKIRGPRDQSMAPKSPVSRLAASQPSASTAQSSTAQYGAAGAYPQPQAGGLNVLLARLLLEAQGARLELGTDDDGAWFALVTFDAQPKA